MHLLAARGAAAFAGADGRDLSALAWAVSKGDTRDRHREIAKEEKARLEEGEVRDVLGHVVAAALGFAPPDLSRIIWSLAFCSSRNLMPGAEEDGTLSRLAQTVIDVVGRSLNKFSVEDLVRGLRTS